MYHYHFQTYYYNHCKDFKNRIYVVTDFRFPLFFNSLKINLFAKINQLLIFFFFY